MHRPKTVADHLAISPATLRSWSTAFAELLSPAAQKAQTEHGGATQRRYTDEDVGVLARAKQLLAEGLTYEEALARLRDEPPPAPVEPTDGVSALESADALVVSSELHMAMVSLREALAAKDETIAALEERVAAAERHLTDLRSVAERPQAESRPILKLGGFELMGRRRGSE